MSPRVLLLIVLLVTWPFAVAVVRPTVARGDTNDDINALERRMERLEDTVGRAERRAGIASSRVVTYHRPREWRENLYTRAPTAPSVELDLIPDWPGVRRPAFLYLWAPGTP